MRGTFSRNASHPPTRRQRPTLVTAKRCATANHIMKAASLPRCVCAWVLLIVALATTDWTNAQDAGIDVSVVHKAGNDNSTIALESFTNSSPVTNTTNKSSPQQAKKNRQFFLFRIFRRDKHKRIDESTKNGKCVKDHTTSFTLKMNEKLEEARRMFLDRMAAVSFTLIHQEKDAAMMNNGTFFQEVDGNDADITPQSDLTLPNRSIYVVTTAALPWRTGTAVNPLLRAAYLTRRTRDINKEQGEQCNAVGHDSSISNVTGTKPKKQYVTLVVPWLELEEDRLELYPNHKFDTPEQQETYIREWLRNDAHMEDEANPDHGLRILFYPARYHSGLKSIFAMGDMVAVLTNQTTDEDDLSDAVCILEEPEHLNWYRAPGDGWTKVFNYVIGIVHTNYVEYASTQFHGLWTAPAIQVMSSAMIRAYCHKVIKLSGVLQTYAVEKESVDNVHGVREDFIREGRRRAGVSLNQTNITTASLDEEAEGQVYYIGKILWAKGFEQMLELQEFYNECTGKYFAIDVYGGGPEEEEIKRAFHGRRGNSKSHKGEKVSDLEELLSREYIKKKLHSIKTSSLEFEMPKSFHELRRKPIPANFLGPVDHALLGEKYKVFVNPSISEVLCTTTFEALAMGKFAIVPIHESNEFFMKFPNCLGYRNKWEFAAALRWALTHEPEPLTPDLAQEFTWEAATDRLIQSSAISRREAQERALLGTKKLDERIAAFHYELGKGTKGDTLRKFLGGGPISNQFRYELAKQGLDTEGSENEGLTRKLSESSFVRAIKTSFSGSTTYDLFSAPAAT